MNQILNPFDDIDPLSIYQKFIRLISNINDKKTLIEIGKLLDKRLSEFK